MQKKSYDEIRKVVDNIKFMDRIFHLTKKGDGWLLQLEYTEEDVVTGKMEQQKARKWYVSPYMTETEIVETAFKACRTSVEHVLKEHFTYEGHRVYSPHFNVRARIEMCKQEDFDGRDLATSIELIPNANGRVYSVRVAGKEIGALRQATPLSGWVASMLENDLRDQVETLSEGVKWFRYILGLINR